MVFEVGPPERGLPACPATDHPHHFVPPQRLNCGVYRAPIDNKPVEVVVQAVDDIPGREFIAKLIGDLNYAIL